MDTVSLPCRRVAVALAITLVGAVLAADPVAAQEPVEYRPPVDAPVVDRFRPPLLRWSAGNRGLTYDIEPVGPVHAAAPGRVVFAGVVAGSRHVTVLHADGLRTSYSFLHAIEVRLGQRVGPGAVIGRAGLGFHFGLRDGDDYLDPAGYFGRVVVHVALVAHDEAPPSTPPSIAWEHAHIRALVRAEQPGLVARVGSMTGALVAGAGEVAAGLGTTIWDELALPLHLVNELVMYPSDLVLEVLQRVFAPCTPRQEADALQTGAAGARGRIAVTVAGLGSSSDAAAVDGLDLAGLGYRPDDVVRFSYRGGRVPAPDVAGDLATIPQTAYDAHDTTSDIVTQGTALADVLEHALATDRAVDVYAHSLGGLVVRVALVELARRGVEPRRLGSVVTVATPHRGAASATLVSAVPDAVADPVTAVAHLAGSALQPSAPAVRDLAQTSDLVRWLDGVGVPDGVRFRTIGFRSDPVVTADTARVPGHPHAVLGGFDPGVHSGGLDSPAVTRELALALADRAPTCGGLVDAILDGAVPEYLEQNTTTLTGIVWWVSERRGRLGPTRTPGTLGG